MSDSSVSGGDSSGVAVLLAGWGLKEGSRFKTWKRRYFLLRGATEQEAATHGSSHILLYYKSPSQLHTGKLPTGAVPIFKSETTVRSVTEKKVQCLEVNSGLSRRLFVAPEVTAAFPDARSVETEWVARLTTLSPPSNACTLRRSTIGDRPVVDTPPGVAEADENEDGIDTDLDPVLEGQPRTHSTASAPTNDHKFQDKIDQTLAKIGAETATIDLEWETFASTLQLAPTAAATVTAEVLDAIGALFCGVQSLETQIHERTAVLVSRLWEADDPQIARRVAPLREALEEESANLEAAIAAASRWGVNSAHWTRQIPVDVSEAEAFCREIPLAATDPALVISVDDLTVQRVLGACVLDKRSITCINAIGAVYTRRRAEVIAELVAAILADIEAYGRAMSAVLATPKERDAVVKLEELCAQIPQTAIGSAEPLTIKTADRWVSAGRDGATPSLDSVGFALWLRMQATEGSIGLYDAVSAVVAAIGHPGTHVIPGGIKKLPRMVFKTLTKYRAEFGRLRDVVRCTVVTSSLESIANVVAAILRTGNVRVVRMKNRFARGYDAKPCGGYRDCQLLVLFQLGKQWRWGEVQVNLDHLVAIKSRPGGGHSVFKFARSLTAFDTNTYTHMGPCTPDTCEQIRCGVLLGVDLQETSLGTSDALDTLAFGLASTRCRVADLNLEDNELGAQGLAVLAAPLKTSSSIERLNLGFNNLFAEGGDIVGEIIAASRTLRQLKLRGSDLETAGTIAVATALRENKTIITIDLSENEMGGDGAAAVAEMLKVNDTIIHINLFENEIDDSGGRALLDALKMNKTILKMNVQGNEFHQVEENFRSMGPRVLI